MPAMKPYAESSEQNKLPILSVLEQWFIAPGEVLEIGSGTGQHAVFFAEQLPHLRWQPSDRQDNLSGISQWVVAANLPNVAPPQWLDMDEDAWPDRQFDYVFSANTVHIMSWRQVQVMFQGIGKMLRPGGVFCLYGPFNYHGRFTSDGNARFDVWLKQRDALSGVRDFAELNELAVDHGLLLAGDHEMPVNNRTLVWRRA